MCCSRASNHSLYKYTYWFYCTVWMHNQCNITHIYMGNILEEHCKWSTVMAKTYNSFTDGMQKSINKDLTYLVNVTFPALSCFYPIFFPHLVALDLSALTSESKGSDLLSADVYLWLTNRFYSEVMALILLKPSHQHLQLTVASLCRPQSCNYSSFGA